MLLFVKRLQCLRYFQGISGIFSNFRENIRAFTNRDQLLTALRISDTLSARSLPFLPTTSDLRTVKF